jgi:heat shock protein HtpX
MASAARPDAVPTTFWREIERNRRRSWLLVLAIVALLAALGAAIGYATGAGWGGVIFAGVVAGVMTVGSYFAGDALVLASSGARPVDVANPSDRHRQLVNVVAEMRLAGGLPMPRVYVIEDSAPNAFATGRDPKRASLGVTTGLLDKLDRDELQGVIGHEMSHIGNLDIRFALLVGVLVGSIALLSDWFLRIAHWGGSDDDDGAGKARLVLWAVALLLALVAPLIARAVQAAVSRSRESLADASAVELTRNPLGLASALRKIAEDSDVLEAANRATQHMYIVNPIKPFEERASALWDTHPPLGERIANLQRIAGQMGLVPGGSHASA